MNNERTENSSADCSLPYFLQFCFRKLCKTEENGSDVDTFKLKKPLLVMVSMGIEDPSLAYFSSSPSVHKNSYGYGKYKETLDATLKNR